MISRKPEYPRTENRSVSVNEVMTLREFGRRLGLGTRACCDAQRQGLRAIMFGRCKFVLGEDVVTWFRRLAGEKDGKPGDGTDHQRQALGEMVLGERRMEPHTVHTLERELEKAIADTVSHLGTKKLPLVPSQDTMQMMAKAAAAVYEAAVVNYRPREG